jgi:hypothetical protein
MNNTISGEGFDYSKFTLFLRDLYNVQDVHQRIQMLLNQCKYLIPDFMEYFSSEEVRKTVCWDGIANKVTIGHSLKYPSGTKVIRIIDVNGKIASIEEFIVHDNLDDIVRSDYNPCLVTTGIEIVEKYPTDLKFDFTKNINEQRNYMVKSSWYDKPLILNSPINWLPGKHNHNTFSNYVEGLYLVHLGRVCLDTYVKLHEDTRNIYFSSTYLETFNKEWYLKHFNDHNHSDQPMMEIPHDIKKLINKII